MISRFQSKASGLIYLDINEIQDDNTLPISIDDIDDNYDVLYVYLTKEDINNLIQVLKNKSKEMK